MSGTEKTVTRLSTPDQEMKKSSLNTEETEKQEKSETKEPPQASTERECLQVPYLRK